jgi:plasmid stability protein
MRTTLTLDEDVAARLQARARESGRSFKEVVNEAIRRGLMTQDEPRVEAPFVVSARPLGLRPGLGYDNVAELLERLDEAMAGAPALRGPDLPPAPDAT